MLVMMVGVALCLTNATACNTLAFVCSTGQTLMVSCTNFTNVATEAEMRCAVEEVAATRGYATVNLTMSQAALELSSELVVPSGASVKVLGNGMVLSGAAARTRLFNQTNVFLNTSSLALHNLTLSGGVATSAGSAVYTLGGSLTLAHTTVVNCLVTASSDLELARGAIFFADIDDEWAYTSAANRKVLRLDVTHSAFQNNTASAWDGHPQGGAVHVKADYGEPPIEVVITSSNFSFNAAEQGDYLVNNDGGGALYTYAKEQGMLELTVTDSLFDQNSARTAGAAFVGWGTYATIADSVFSWNLADQTSHGYTDMGGGGGIFLQRWAQLELSGVVAHNNQAWGASSSSLISGQGGFIMADDWSLLQMSGCTCFNNYADTHGGCISAMSNVNDVFTSSFFNNTAEFGAEIMLRTLSKLYSYDSSFASPTAGDAFLVHAFDSSEVIFDSSTVTAFGEHPKAFVTDAQGVIRNTDVTGTVAFKTFYDNGMNLESANSTGYIATCADLDNNLALQTTMKCSSAYCSDVTATNGNATATGIDCYCNTRLHGNRDPIYQGCEDPPLIHVLRDNYVAKVDKPDNVTQTYWFKNEGDEDLVWSAAVAYHEPGHHWELGVAEGNLSSCEVGHLTVTLESLDLDSYQTGTLVVDLTSNSYAWTIPDDDTVAATSINTTVQLTLKYLIRASVDAAHTVLVTNETLGVTNDSVVELDPAPARGFATAGSTLEASIVPGDIAGRWIQGSPGAEKFSAHLIRPSQTDADTKRVCAVRFSSSSDSYRVECSLDEYAAGPFLLVATHGNEAESLAQTAFHVNVSCPVGFVQIDRNESYPTYPTCGCARGERLDVSEAKCKPCPSNTYGRSQVSIYEPNTCQSCNSVLRDSVTRNNGETTIDACVCNPEFYLVQWDFDEPRAITAGSLMGRCDECPEGTSCPNYGTDTSTLAVDEGYWRAWNGTDKVYTCPGPPNGDTCVGSDMRAPTNGSDDTWPFQLSSSPCSPGYESPLCSTCLHEFYRDLDGMCKDCETLGWGSTLVASIFLLIFGTMAAAMLFMMYTAAVALHRGDKKRQLEREAAEKAKKSATLNRKDSRAVFKGAFAKVKLANNLGFAAAMGSEMANSGVIDVDSALESQGLYQEFQGCMVMIGKVTKKFRKPFKIILDEMQLQGSVSLTLFPAIPLGCRTLYSLLSIMTLDLNRILPMECYFAGYNFHDVLVINTLMPIFLVVAFMSLCFAADKLKDSVDDSELRKSKGRREKLILKLISLGPNFRLIAVFMLYMNYAKACITVFQVFKCDTFEFEDHSEKLLAVDLSIDCASDTHLGYVVYGVLMILLLPIGIPIGFYVLLWSFRDKLSLAWYYRQPQYKDMEEEDLLDERLTDKDLRSFTFLYRNYNSRLYWWESVECARKCFFVLLIVFFPPGSTEQVLFSMLIYFFMFTLVADFSPFADPLDTKMSMICYASTFVALAVGIVLITESTLSETEVTILFFLSSLVPLIVGLVSTFLGTTGSIEHLLDAKDKFFERRRAQVEAAAKTNAPSSLQDRDVAPDAKVVDEPACEPGSEGEEDGGESPAKPRARLPRNPFSHLQSTGAPAEQAAAPTGSDPAGEV